MKINKDLFIDGKYYKNMSMNTLPVSLDNLIDNTQYKILWSNSDWNAGFTSKTITVLDDSQYEYLMLIYDCYVPYQNFGCFIFKKPDLTYQIPYGMCLYDGGITVRHRYISRQNSTTYHFTDGRANGTSNNAIGVPLRLIGFNLSYKND